MSSTPRSLDRKTQPRLFILRGLHDLAMVDEVARKVAGYDVVFYESIATQEERVATNKFMTAVSTSESYAAQVDTAELERLKHPFLQIAWKLRGKNIIFVAVDTELKPGQTADEIVNTNFDLHLEKLRQAALSNDIQPYYKAMESSVMLTVRAIQERDEQVANQVKLFVDFMAEKGRYCDKLALIQGYNHRTAPLLAKLLPDYDIREDTYNEAMMQEVLSFPYNQMIDQKIQHPDEPVSQALIDRLTVSILSLPDDKDVAPEVQNQKITISSYYAKSQHRDMLSKLNDDVKGMSDQAIHERMLELLQKAGESERASSPV